MSTPKRVIPWHTFSIAKGNTIQVGALLGSLALSWYAGRQGVRGTPWMVASRLLAYFSEHAFSHWLVGRALGVRFTGYGLHGTSHPQYYPPGMRFLFSHLPLLSARTDPASLKQSTPAARAAMYAAGTVATVIASVAIPGYAWRRGVPRARGFFVGTNLWNVPLILSESLRAGGDLRRAWRELRRIIDHSKRSWRVHFTTLATVGGSHNGSGEARAFICEYRIERFTYSALQHTHDLMSPDHGTRYAPGYCRSHRSYRLMGQLL